MTRETEAPGIQSLEQAYFILKKVAESNRPLTISELSVKCAISKSKLHRYLVSLCRVGLLSKGSDLKYTLGSELILLGLRASDQIDVKTKAQPYIDQLNRELNETVALAIWGSGGPFFLRWQDSNKSVNIGIKAGSRVSLIRSATGMIFAAYMPAERTEKLLQVEMDAECTDTEKIQECVATIISSGYAFTEGGLIPGIAAISAPVFNQHGLLEAAITVVGVIGVIDVKPDSYMVKRLKQVCSELSSELGYR
jgi:DNA-binding IclR family transcriptional regulator